MQFNNRPNFISVPSCHCGVYSYHRLLSFPCLSKLVFINIVLIGEKHIEYQYSVFQGLFHVCHDTETSLGLHLLSGKANMPSVLGRQCR